MKRLPTHRKSIGVAWHRDHDGVLYLHVLGMEPPSLNEIIGWHWSRKHSMRDNLTLILRSRGDLPRFKGPVTVSYFRSRRSIDLDEDNLAGSFKLVGDALKHCGVVEDDKPSILRLEKPTQGKRGKLGPRFTLAIRPGHT